MTPSAPPQSAPSRLPRWLRSGFWSVADQGLFSVTNLVVTILLGRAVAPHDYGAFAVAFSVFLILGVFHNAFLTQPMLVFGSEKYGPREREYLGALLLGHAALTVIGGVILGLVAIGCYVIESHALGRTMLAAAVSAPFMLLLWLMRRVGYLRSTPYRAAEGGLVYLILVCAAIIPLYQHNALNIERGFLVMGGGSLLAGIWLIWRERLWLPSGGMTNPIVREVMRDHRTFGLWAAAAGFVNFVPQHLSYQIVGVMKGLEGSAELRAIYNLVQPLLLANVALCVILVPTLVRQRNTPQFAKTVRFSILALVGMSALYWIGMSVFYKPVMELAYHGRYHGTFALVCIMCAQPMFTALLGVYNSVLESHQRPDRVFFAGVIAAMASIILGVILTQQHGLIGMAAATLFAFILNAAISIFFAIGVMRRSAIYTGSKMQPAEFDVERIAIDPGPTPQVAATNPVKPIFIAFACEPGPGSEPAVGWNTVYAASRLYPVWVVTHPLHRENLDAWLERNNYTNIHPIYCSLPRGLEWMWNTHFTLNLYYYFWQRAASRCARREHKLQNFDVAHHITYVRYWMPSAAATIGIPYVFGPVGGGENAPMNLYRATGLMGYVEQLWRSITRKIFEFDPRTRRTNRNAAVAIACSEETAEPMRKLGAAHVHVASSIGNLSAVELPPPDDSPRPFRLISVGRLLHWKGFAFGLQAFAKANLPDAEYVIAGDGPARGSLERLAAKLGIADRVRFTGESSRSQVLAQIRDSDVLVHPSLHDSGGMVVLEAMDLSKPAIVLKLGGPAVHLDDESGIRVAATSVTQVVDDLSAAMIKFHADPVLRKQLGENGKRRVVEQFGWGTKAVWYDRLYRQAMRIADAASPTHAWAGRQTAEANINA